MQGIDISQKFYFEFGEPMLKKEFPDLYPRLACGVVGEGSDCFIYDDELSKDHDYHVGFCIFLSDADKDSLFEISRFYNRLPKEFMGLTREPLNPFQYNRRGGILTSDFYKRFLGSCDLPKNDIEWLYIPEIALATATNGRVFYDGLGEFSRVRNELLKGYPKDVMLKKLCAHLAYASQSGQYNYDRLLKRGDIGGQMLSINIFVKHIISIAYLLNNKYEPFYKWAFRGMKDFNILQGIDNILIDILKGINVTENITKIVVMLNKELKSRNLISPESDNLQTLGIEITKRIENIDIRNLHILDGVSD